MKDLIVAFETWLTDTQGLQVLKQELNKFRAMPARNTSYYNVDTVWDAFKSFALSMGTSKDDVETVHNYAIRRLEAIFDNDPVKRTTKGRKIQLEEKTNHVTCWKCLGSGQLGSRGQYVCKTCDGTGKTSVPPDEEEDTRQPGADYERLHGHLPEGRTMKLSIDKLRSIIKEEIEVNDVKDKLIKKLALRSTKMLIPFIESEAKKFGIYVRNDKLDTLIEESLFGALSNLYNKK